MVGKLAAKSANVDWEKIDQLTEIPRTYEIRLKSGGIIFKLMKPSQMKKLMPNGTMKNKWESAKIVSIVR